MSENPGSAFFLPFPRQSRLIRKAASLPDAAASSPVCKTEQKKHRIPPMLSSAGAEKSDHICQFFDQLFRFLPAQARIGDGLSVNTAADLLISVHDVAFNHKALYNASDVL